MNINDWEDYYQRNNGCDYSNVKPLVRSRTFLSSGRSILCSSCQLCKSSVIAFCDTGETISTIDCIWQRNESEPIIKKVQRGKCVLTCSAYKQTEEAMITNKSW